jgi:hypothetical protein
MFPRFAAVPVKNSFWMKLLLIFVCLMTLLSLVLSVEKTARSGMQREFAVAAPDGNPLLTTIPLYALILVLVLGAWFMVRLLNRFPRVLTYELGLEALVIETGWRPVRVPYAEIESVEETTLKGWPMRNVGTELKGIYWGSFTWSAVPGRRINLYATQLKPIVLIRAEKRSFGLSPADAAGFVGALRERFGRR